jgi:hypothetical protein
MNTKLENKPVVVTGGDIDMQNARHFVPEGVNGSLSPAMLGILKIQITCWKMLVTAPRHLSPTGDFCGAFWKVPFFLRHLWCALAE